MKQLKYIFLLSLVIIFSACQKNLMDEVEDGKWNKERNILEINFEGQVGDAAIIRNGNDATVEFVYNAINFPLDKVKLKSIAASFNAQTSVKEGDMLDFTKDVAITVTPVHGDPLEWKIKLTEFKESLEGDWKISDLMVYGGTGAEYWGTAVLNMCEKPWSFADATGPKVELDNEVTFTLEEISFDGITTSGKIVNNAGPDGKYADFIFIGVTPNVDVNNYYRQLPKGEGKWSRNYKTNTITITFADNSVHTCKLRNPGEQVYLDWMLGSRTIPTTSLEFALSGTDYWDDIYNDYGRFVKNPRLYWIDLKR